MSKELILTLVTFVLGVLPASCLSVGCKGPQETSQDFAANVATSVKAAQDLGVEAEGTLVLKPDLKAGLFSGFWSDNSSVAVIHLKADPAKGKLLDEATSK